MRPAVALLPSISLLLAGALTAFVYWPGLTGGFLFDDYPNLGEMGNYGGVVDWESFRAFVFSGWSGPTGRPLSLASFLLDDNTWPSHAPLFKQTNLLIQLLCGLLLCWATLLLLRNLKTVSERQAQWIAVLACALWLLHPYMVSTTLYVVQRMAQLATLFCLAGIALYLYARLQLATRPRRAYLLMTLAVGAGTLLATLSKENGALLPLLVLVIEFCLPKQGKPAWQWRAAFLWLPSIAIAVLLARYIDFSDNPWPNRNFNQIERLLTEARIVCEYLLHLFVPRIEGNGLYQDGHVISIGLFEPLSTVLAIAFLSALAVLAFCVRNRAPLVTLAILFFLAAHLMESTVIGLELYFEHRNHLASLFLFLPLAYYGVICSARFKLLPLLAVVVLGILASMTWLRASLWSDSDKLELYWVQSATDSPRAINAVAAHYLNHGDYEKANDYLLAASQRLSHSSLLTARLLLQKVWVGQASEQDFIQAGERLKLQQFDAQTVKGVRTLVERVVGGNAASNSADYARYSLNLLDAMESSPVYGQFPLFVRLVAYLRAQLYLHLGDVAQAYEHYSLAISRYQEADAALAMVAEMATAGHSAQALALLEQAAEVLDGQEARSLKRSRTSYEQDIAHLRNVLSEAMQTQNTATETP
ncbi:tetratricopeptide repeat protein [Pseudomonas saudiphocaensis]|uniref:tetratricopeptide repeat protein n=1 Tax=Pseudomonas saudiphocaensis TaxID=1499686 RepID=UPI00187D3110|nr:tetratricopeptide repeat protein [Pseudomonas saudiphocaensis]MBE7927343.1 tetratricopeptide repeat protein [Pseudomonas saudiphocaensis]